MRSIQTLLKAIVCLSLCAVNAHAQTDIADKEVRDILRGHLYFIKDGIGIVVGIVDANGVRVISDAKGGEGSAGFDGDTVFEIGSISKVFTTTLLADMVERGEVSLGDPISKYVPPSVKTPKRNGQEITLWHLATHTSGLQRMPDNFVAFPQLLGIVLCPFCAVDTSALFEKYSSDDLDSSISSYRLKRDIGTEVEYSNWGMALLGRILSRRAGVDYETLVQTRITKPLLMDRTGVNLTPEMKVHLAPGHRKDGKPEPNWDMTSFAGAGGLRSTANDLLKFVAANLDLKSSPLQPAMKLAQQQQAECCGGWYSSGLGLGWYIFPQFHGEIVGHSGATGGYQSYIVFDKSKKKGSV